jgi:hypothetical protein
VSALRLPKYDPLDEVDALLKRALLNARDDGLPTQTGMRGLGRD